MKELKKAAIYHFTDQSEKRPGVYKKQLKILYDYAISLGFSVEDVFCDMDLHITKHPEFERFLNTRERFDVLIAKDFYHLGHWTRATVSTMKEIHASHIDIYTLENGTFRIEDTIAPLNRPLNVAIYVHKHGASESHRHTSGELQTDILKLFIDKKTDWNLIDQYIDETPEERRQDRDQKQLQKLVQNSDRYDLLLVHGLYYLNHRTAKFCKIREQMKLDIYSLQDGFLRYHGGDRN